MLRCCVRYKGDNMELIKRLPPERINGRSISMGLFRCPKCKEAKKRRLSNGRMETCSLVCRKAKHGDTKKGANGTLYNSWKAMKARCYIPSNKRFKHYGGRGIRVCIQWYDYRNFKKWALANGHRNGLTIDRRDNDGHYEPENCQWITRKENTIKGNQVNLMFNIAEAEEIRKIHLFGKFPTKRIAKVYGCSMASIYRIINNESYRQEVTCNDETL